MKHLDSSLIKQALLKEKRLKANIKPLLKELNNISVMSSLMNEDIDNDNFDLSERIKEIEKSLLRIKRSYKLNERKLNNFLNTKKILFEQLYKKYQYKEVQEEMKRHKKELEKRVLINPEE